MRKRRKMSRKYKKMAINRRADRPRRVLTGSLAVVLVVLCAGLAWMLYSTLKPESAGPQVSSSGAPSSGAPLGGDSQSPSGQEDSSEPVSSEPAPKKASITILGAGDNWITKPIYNQASQNGYAPLYAPIASAVQKADIAVVNQEGLLSNALPVSFGSTACLPTAVGDALAELGFNVINHANSHALDKGEQGLSATLDYWKAKQVRVVGAYSSAEDLQAARLWEKNGIKVAFVGVTEGTNFHSLSSDSPYRVLLAGDRDELKKQIELAKSQADVVVVSAHWGNEFTFAVTQKQKALAQDMVNWGADIILGHHPHNLQELTVLTRESDGARCPVAYSLGNLVTTQNSAISLVNGLLTVTVEKDFETGKTSFSEMQFLPTVVHYESGTKNIAVYPLNEYTDAMAAKHGIRSKTSKFDLKYIQGIITTTIPDEFLSH